MRFRKSVKCGRCGLTTTYSNEVEFNLWQSRPGCPACFKRRDDSGEHDETPPTEELGIAELANWYAGEVDALQHLLFKGVLTNDEAIALKQGVRHGVRVALGLEPIGADEQ